MKDYVFLNRPDYFATLARCVELARRGERVIVTAMVFDPYEPMIIRLVSALQTAARHGANVTLLIDAHNFLRNRHGRGFGPLFYRTKFGALTGAFAATANLLQTLEDAGGKYCITNMPRRRFNSPSVGRSHIKAAVVGNRVFIGGCNLERPTYIDIMVTWTSGAAAGAISNWLLKVAESGSVRHALGNVDMRASLDSTTRLLLDVGVPGQSLIYNEALALIDNAKAWIYLSCQYFPGGPTAKHLAAAQARGVRVEIDFSHPRTHGSSAALHHAYQVAQRTRGLPWNFFAGRLDKRVPKLHAKILATDQGAMVGSHNFVVQGVRFGTAEMALQSLDPEFSVELRDFIIDQLAAQPYVKHRQRTQTGAAA